MVASLLASLGSPVYAEPQAGPVERFLEEHRESAAGTFSLDARLRYEFADIDGLDEAHATTLRARLGFRTPEWRGLSLFAEGEAIVALDDDAYFDGVGSPNGKSPIADPEDADLNQLSVRYQGAPLGTTLIGGRQRLVLDDARFVGDVGWRQNDQTFDAVVVRSSLGLDDLEVTYGYLWDVHRIFGDKGPPGRRDFDSNSHLLNATWRGLADTRATFFAYLLDFDSSPLDSADTLGLRLSGKAPLSSRLHLAWSGSFARQHDAGDNPVNYRASYLAAEAGLVDAELGRIAVGFESLGSDGGRARFVTPLATAHKFNGWADTFLDNGGPRGLRDLYLVVAPTLPGGLSGQLVYHHFRSDHGGQTLGDEIDLVVRYPLTPHLSLLAKLARFNRRNAGPSDRLRGSLQTDWTF